MKNVQIPPKKEQDKPLLICEFEGHDVMSSAIGHFHLGECELKKIADKMVKSLTKKKGT